MNETHQNSNSIFTATACGQRQQINIATYNLFEQTSTITYVTNTTSTLLYEYNFDACSVRTWSFVSLGETKALAEQIPISEAVREGRRRDKDNWSYTLDNEPDLFAGRGFTGHEYLPWFMIYNMNGRLYDPVVGRFLSPDNNVQMPDFTQNFNRYSYALNNPLKYTDPDGEIIFTILAAMFFPPALPFAIAADIGSIINVASNWNNIDNFGEGLAYYGIGAASGATSQIPGFGIPLAGFVNGAGNEFLNTDILTEDVTWNDLDGSDAGRILLAGGIGMASSYYGAKWGGQLSDKAINGLGVESLFMKNAIEKTSQGFTGGYINGFFDEVMLRDGDLNSAVKRGFVQGGWGAAFGFTFSSAEYSLNRAGVEQYWTSKELSLKIKSPFDDYYEYNFKYENGTQPNSPYYQYNPRLTPKNNWQIPMRAPTPAPYNPLNLWKTIYPELYYPWAQ